MIKISIVEIDIILMISLHSKHIIRKNNKLTLSYYLKLHILKQKKHLK